MNCCPQKKHVLTTWPPAGGAILRSSENIWGNIPIARKQQVLGMGPWVFVSGFSVLFSLLPNCHTVALPHHTFLLPRCSASVCEGKHPWTKSPKTKNQNKLSLSLKFLLSDIWSWRKERLARLAILQTVDLINQSTNSTHVHTHTHLCIYT